MGKFVVAGTYSEFIDYLKRKDLYGPEYTFVYSADQLRGHSNIEGFYIGTYEQRPDIDQIRENIAYIKSRNKAQP